MLSCIIVRMWCLEPRVLIGLLRHPVGGTTFVLGEEDENEDAP